MSAPGKMRGFFAFAQNDNVADGMTIVERMTIADGMTAVAVAGG